MGAPWVWGSDALGMARFTNQDGNRRGGQRLRRRRLLNAGMSRIRTEGGGGMVAMKPSGMFVVRLTAEPANVRPSPEIAYTF